MTPKQWWFGIAVVTAAIVFHALFPRYVTSTAANGLVITRTDRWRGIVETARLRSTEAPWMIHREDRATLRPENADQRAPSTPTRKYSDQDFAITPPAPTPRP